MSFGQQDSHALDFDSLGLSGCLVMLSGTGPAKTEQPLVIVHTSILLVDLIRIYCVANWQIEPKRDYSRSNGTTGFCQSAMLHGASVRILKFYMLACSQAHAQAISAGKRLTIGQ